jgi:nucleotide-binding universal stress UspA family protein
VDGEIARAFRATAANLLVMGAYSRHRVRERIFGGVTETMLFRSTLPVLMYHP